MQAGLRTRGVLFARFLAFPCSAQWHIQKAHPLTVAEAVTALLFRSAPCFPFHHRIGMMQRHLDVTAGTLAEGLAMVNVRSMPPQQSCMGIGMTLRGVLAGKERCAGQLLAPVFRLPSKRV